MRLRRADPPSLPRQRPSAPGSAGLARLRHACVRAALVLGWVVAGCAPARRPAPPRASTAPEPRPAPAALERAAPPATPLQGELAEGRRGAVSSAEANASDIGLAVLRRGGNAVDAAIAVAFALGVTHPSAGNIGGGGFMLVRLPDGTATAIDYREVAPGAASRDMFLDAAGRPLADRELGPRAAGIPGVVAGLAWAHEHYASLPWAELVLPAVQLAERGWRLDALHAEELAEVSANIAAYARRVPPRSVGLLAALRATLATFQPAERPAYAAGDLWRQPELAVTLRSIMQHGAQAFYTGAFARELADEVQAMGGLWTAADLEHYRVVERAPVRFAYRGHELISMPPPSAGGVTLRQIFAGSELLGLPALPWDSVQRAHLFVELLRRSFADRNARIADPAFVDVPLAQLLNVDYVARRLRDVDPARATPSSQIAAGTPLSEAAETTHFSVVDASGMAVANTYTLNGDFGAQVQIPGTGITLNDEMDDFTAQVGAPNQFGLIQGPQNAIAPGKRMLSSMSPTIVLKDGKLRAVLGSPGGPTIITTVAQIALQLIDAGRSLEQAVAAPRLHHQWLPDQIWYEPGVPETTLRALRALGHRVVPSDGFIGHANCIEVQPETGLLRAVADVRRYGGKAAAF